PPRARDPPGAGLPGADSLARPGRVDDRVAGVLRLLRDLALPPPAARARLLGPGHLHRVRQAAVAAAGADRGRPRARIRPARRSFPDRPGGAGAVLPAV